MKKILFLLSFLCAGIFANAEEVTFDFDANYATLFPGLKGTSSNDSHDGDITTDMTTPAIGGVTITVSAKTSGNNENRIWYSSPRLRMYSGTLTVESAGSDISYIKFTTGSNFNIASADAGTLTGKEWTGSAKKIVFTIQKNTQIDKMEITTGGGAPVVKPVLYAINFTKDQTDWSISNKVMPDDLTYVWTANNYGYVASAYANNTSYATEAWLISPVMDMTKASDVELTINHAGNKFGGKVEDQVSVLATTDGTNWAPLKVAAWPAGNSWTFNESAVDISSLAGKNNVQIAFKYTSTTESAGTYEISEFTIKGNGSITTGGGEEGVTAPVINFDASSKTVTITDPSGNNFDIYYTTDGTNPAYGVAGTKYTAPFTIETTTTVKAICVSDWEESSSITTKLCSLSEDYNTLAEVKAVAANYTSATIEVKLNLNNVLVTGVNGSNVFVQDNTGSFLFYGSGSKLAKGDIISGSISGKPYMYNGLPEMSITDGWASVAVVSHDNAVSPVVMKAANVTANDANKYVRFEGLKFIKSETVSNKTNYTLTDGTTNIVLRDNFNNLGSISWNVGDAYSYNINVFVIPYKSDLQYYAVSDKDVEMVSSKVNPETEFAKAVEMVDLNAKNYTPEFQTKSDGAKTWTSSNTHIATINESGVATILHSGVTTITLETAETETYQPSKATITLAVMNKEADGSKAKPLGVGDVQAMFAYYNHSSQEVVLDTIADKWVKAYIVGCADGSLSKAIFGTEGAVESNLLISDDASTTDVNNCIPAALDSKSAAREALNLKSHPENLGQPVLLHGSIIKYFSVAGLKSITEFELGAGLRGDANNDGFINVNDITTIATYILNGNADNFNFGNADVNGDGTINVNDITGTAAIILEN